MRKAKHPRSLPWLAAIIVAVAVYGFAIEPRRLTVTAVTLRQGALAAALDGRRAVLLSDLHFRGDGEAFLRRILARLDAIQPDIVFLAGDYVRWGRRGAAYEEALAFLSRLHAPLGVYAVTGDSDKTYSRKSCEFCHEPGSGARTRRHGVTFLKDSPVTLKTAGGEIEIAGVDAETETGSSFNAVAARLTAGDLPVILLAHSSTAYQAIDPSREVLVLSGDTHGGQVRLPGWVWRIWKRKPDPAHFYGFYRDGRKSLFVTRGLGTSWPYLRLGEPPEIAVLEFHR